MEVAPTALISPRAVHGPLARLSQPAGLPIARAGGVVTFAVLLLAFDDLPALLPVGELSNDWFIYTVPALLLYLLGASGQVVFPRPLLYFGLAFSVVALVGLGINYHSIGLAYFKQRSGVGRVFTQGLTFGFGIVIAFIFSNFALRGLVRPIVKGARLGLLVMATMGALELCSWYSVPGLAALHDAIATFVHANSGLSYVNRLRTTAFEVSWAGVILSFFFPFACIELDNRRHGVRLYSVIVLSLTVLAQSRTAFLAIGTQAIIMLWFRTRRRADLLVHGAALAGATIIVALFLSSSLSLVAADTFSNLVEHGTFQPPDDGSAANVSNITRGASINAALSMFAEQPLFGIGLGQFGFYYPYHLRSEDYRSWEVAQYVTDGLPIWPPAFSVHLRILAETGVIGYLVWIGFILALLKSSMAMAMRRDLPSEVRTTQLAIALVLFGFLMLGASIDSFRFFGGWIAIGLCLGLHPIGPAGRVNERRRGPIATRPRSVRALDELPPSRSVAGALGATGLQKAGGSRK